MGKMLISSLTASADLLRRSPSLMTAYMHRVSECKHLASVKYCADIAHQNKLIMLMHQIKTHKERKKISPHASIYLFFIPFQKIYAIFFKGVFIVVVFLS